MKDFGYKDGLRWYKDGLRFECQECGNCCVSHGDNAYVYMARADVQAASGHCRMSKGEFVDRYCERQGSWLQLVNRGSDCVFLEDGRCAIYPVRPKQCATWPFWTENLDFETWHTTVMSLCPGIGHGKLYTLSEIERIARERDSWYSILRSCESADRHQNID